MYNFKYQALAKALFCLSLFLHTESSIAGPLDDEDSNLSQLSRIHKRLRKDKRDPKDYLVRRPELLQQASSRLSLTNKSFIINHED